MLCRMKLNETADWSDGEINVRPELIEHFWSPDIIIHDLIRCADGKSFTFAWAEKIAYLRLLNMELNCSYASIE